MSCPLFLRFARLLSPVALALASSAACAPISVATPGPSGDDTANPDAGFDAAATADSGGGVTPEASACLPGDVATYHPVYHSPAVQPQACNGDPTLVDAFFDACLGGDRSDALCMAFRSANPDCAACIVTPESAMAYGPIVDHGAFVTANVAGCIEVEVEAAADAGPSGSDTFSCAKAVDALEGCELAACEANCPVSSSSPASLSQYQACTAAADGAGCRTFAGATACTFPDSGVGVPQTCTQSDFGAFYRDVVPLFCLPPHVDDAGLSAVDAGTGD
jgi:hypothetical protein